MIELLISPKSVKSEVIKIPIYALVELYPDKNGAIESARKMMTIPDSVLRDRTFPLILAIIFSSFSYFVSSRTVMV